MNTLLFWSITITVIAALLVGAFRVYIAWRSAKRTTKAKQWLNSLDKAELLALITAENSGLDRQDLDSLVQLAFESYPEGQKDAIVARIAEHLNL